MTLGIGRVGKLREPNTLVSAVKERLREMDPNAENRWECFHVGSFLVRGDRLATIVYPNSHDHSYYREVRIPVDCFRVANEKILTALWNSSDWSILKRMRWLR